MTDAAQTLHDVAAAAFDARRDEGPVMLLNLLRFKPDGGKELYDEYRRANAPLRDRFGIRTVFEADLAESLIGEARWHRAFVMAYSSRQMMVDMLDTPLYRENEDLRTRALEASELHAMDPSGNGPWRQILPVHPPGA